MRLLTELRSMHQNAQGLYMGVDGIKGVVGNMKEIGIHEPMNVKAQIIKTAIETCCMLLRIDDIVSGIKKGKD